MARFYSPLRLLLRSLLLTVLVWIGASSVYAAPGATFTVDRTDDNAGATACGAAANDCSLRGAITNANGVAGADTIVIPAGTYTLSVAGILEDNNATGDLDITSDITFLGGGMSLAIVDANDIDRVFDIIPVASGTRTVTFRDMTIQNGNTPDTGTINQGGGIAYRTTAGTAGTPTITLIEVRVLSNEVTDTGGGGISVAKTGSGANSIILSVQNSTIANNTANLTGTTGGVGGGISCTNCTLNIGNSTISGNIANQNSAGANLGGGGIYATGNTASVSIVASTISGNQTNSSGGGILLTAGAATATVSLDFVTVANNRADLNNDGSGNGGGIRNNAGTFNLRNTIIADNTDGTTTANQPDCAGAVVSGNYNLLENTAGCSGGTAANDITGSDPSLGPLANNGGPSNPPHNTHAVTIGPVINSIPNGTNGCSGGVTRDQRGAIRAGGAGLGGAACERGAYEFNSPPLAVTLASFEAVAQDENVLVMWETAQESNNAGFNLYRSLNPNDGGVLLNAELIPSQVPGGGGASYAYTDATVAEGTTYYYWLESVATDGATERYGPVSVTTNSPTAINLSDVGIVSQQQGLWAGLMGLVLVGLLVAWPRIRR